jgi:hypothetical protein
MNGYVRADHRWRRAGNNHLHFGRNRATGPFLPRPLAKHLNRSGVLRKISAATAQGSPLPSARQMSKVHDARHVPLAVYRRASEMNLQISD